MAKTLSDMLTGMQAYFLGRSVLTNVIDRRLFEVADPLQIASETVAQEAVASHGQFVVWTSGGESLLRLKGGLESKLRFAVVDFACWGKYPADCRALREILLGEIGMGLSETWGIVTVKNAHWNTDANTTGRDETVDLSFATAQLIVPYLND